MQLPSTAVPPGAVVAVEVDGAEFVVWRGLSGALGSAPRNCPHLDWDLLEAVVVGGEEVRVEPLCGRGVDGIPPQRRCERRQRGDFRNARNTQSIHV